MNIQKDDGYTSLHLAALNDHIDVVTSLAELVSACTCASDVHVCIIYLLFQLCFYYTLYIIIIVLLTFFITHCM